MSAYWPPSAARLGMFKDVNTTVGPAEGADVALVENPDWDPENPDAVPRWIRGTVASSASDIIVAASPPPPGEVEVNTIFISEEGRFFDSDGNELPT